MLLTIDAGNTNTVFAIFDGEELLGQWRIHSNAVRTADEYAIWLTQLMELQHMKPSQVTAAITSCVIPHALFDLKQLCKRYFHTELLVVGEEPLGSPITVELDPHAEAGADRLVNAFAAWGAYKKACVIVDFGTATTFDVVSNEGAYIGGVIAPGVHLSLNALQEAAAKLPNITIKSRETVIGKNTTHAMQSGIYYGYASMVDGIIDRIKKEYGQEMKVLATGGLANLYAKEISAFDKVDQELTIQGLRMIFQSQ